MVIVLLVIAAFYFMSGKGNAAANTAGSSSADGIGPPGCGGVGGFIKDHVARKNAIAPTVISKYTGIGGGTAKEIAGVAGKLDVSAYAENFVGSHLGNALCNLDPLSAAASGAKFLGSEIAAGAEFLGGKIADGAKAVGSGALGFASAPGTKITGYGASSINLGGKLATATTGLVDRGVNAAYSKLPTPLKVAAAPAVITQKVVSTVVKAGTGAVSKAGGAIASGVKSTEHAVSSAASKVIGWL